MRVAFSRFQVNEVARKKFRRYELIATLQRDTKSCHVRENHEARVEIFSCAGKVNGLSCVLLLPSDTLPSSLVTVPLYFPELRRQNKVIYSRNDGSYFL